VTAVINVFKTLTCQVSTLWSQLVPAFGSIDLFCLLARTFQCARVNELGSEGMWEAEFLVKPVLFPSVVIRRQGNQSLAFLLLRQTASCVVPVERTGVESILFSLESCQEGVSSKLFMRCFLLL